MFPRAVVPDKEHSSARVLTFEELRFDIVDTIPLADAVRPIVVIVNADDVGRNTLPTIIPDYRSCRIERLSQIEERLHIVSLGGIVRKIRNAP